MKTQTTRTREELVHMLKQILPAVREKYKVDGFILFGSFARGEQLDSSDVDIAFNCEDTFPYDEQFQLQDELSAMLGVKVDLVDYKALHEIIKGRVIREGIAV